MSVSSTIEWTDATWNPMRGCTKVSPGCAHCYAETFAERFRGVVGNAYFQGFDPRMAPEMLAEPFRWSKSKKVFVNSMSDFFHDAFPLEYLKRVASVMKKADWHVYQILTKRADRMQEMLCGPLRDAAMLPHVWWGVSVENRRHGLPRIENLRSTPARVKFLSVEPLIEDLGPIDLTGIDWVIAGGESGWRARPMDPNWVRSLRDQCESAGVPFFFKQWGGVRKGKTGRLLDGQTYDEMPKTETRATPDRVLRRMWADELKLGTNEPEIRAIEGGVSLL